MAHVQTQSLSECLSQLVKQGITSIRIVNTNEMITIDEALVRIEQDGTASSSAYVVAPGKERSIIQTGPLRSQTFVAPRPGQIIQVGNYKAVLFFYGDGVDLTLSQCLSFLTDQGITSVRVARTDEIIPMNEALQRIKEDGTEKSAAYMHVPQRQPASLLEEWLPLPNTGVAIPGHIWQLEDGGSKKARFYYGDDALRLSV